MSSDKNSNKTIFNKDVESVTTQSKDGKKSKNLSLTINQGAAARKTKVQVWLDDDSSDNTDHVGISLNLEKRNMTCPDINPLKIQQDKVTPAPRNVHSLSLYQTQSSTRKSFLGELKNILTFNKKQDDTSAQDGLSAAPSGHVTVEKEYEKENKKVALQNRRKQVFQNPEEPENNELSTFSTVGVTVSTFLFIFCFPRYPLPCNLSFIGWVHKK